jgi:hypothetical protein
LADLVVEASGGKLDRSVALDWLLHSPTGNALAARHKKADAEPAKETMTMTRDQHLQKIAEHGVVALAKMLAEDGDSRGISETEFTALVTAEAKRAHPQLSEAQAFAKVFSASTDDGAALRRAHATIKNAGWLSDGGSATGLQIAKGSLSS